MQLYADLSKRMYVSAQQYDLMLLELGAKIKSSGYEPEHIVAAERGGFAPLRRLLDMFPHASYDTIRVKHYQEDGVTLEKPEIIQPLRNPNLVKGKRVLVVDDCTDTGKTAQVVEKYLLDLGASEVKVGVLFHKPHSQYTPAWYVDTTTCWIYFFYETIDAARQLLQNDMSIDKISKYFRQLKVPEEEIKWITIHLQS
jgi:hypoxanthine phosphoribosyltransferase